MNKVQDISTPLATVVTRDFMNDPNPIGGTDAVYVKKEDNNRKAKVTTGKAVLVYLKEFKVG